MRPVVVNMPGRGEIHGYGVETQMTHGVFLSFNEDRLELIRIELMKRWSAQHHA